jgi:hypothetical protein
MISISIITPPKILDIYSFKNLNAMPSILPRMGFYIATKVNPSEHIVKIVLEALAKR